MAEGIVRYSVPLVLDAIAGGGASTGVTVKSGANGKCQSWRWPLLTYMAIPFNERFSGRWSLRKVDGKAAGWRPSRSSTSTSKRRVVVA